jgi:hypothetical protein
MAEEFSYQMQLNGVSGYSVKKREEDSEKAKDSAYQSAEHRAV